MQCEMCGKDTDLFVAEIEGSDIKVCSGCAKFGRVLRRVSVPPKDKSKGGSSVLKKAPEEPEIIEVVIEGFGAVLKNKREKMGLTQKDLAIKLAEKETLLQKLESENIEPSISLAKKLEKFLGVKLIEEVKETKILTQKGKNSSFTLGDFVKVRKRK